MPLLELLLIYLCSGIFVSVLVLSNLQMLHWKRFYIHALSSVVTTHPVVRKLILSWLTHIAHVEQRVFLYSLSFHHPHTMANNIKKPCCEKTYFWSLWESFLLTGCRYILLPFSANLWVILLIPWGRSGIWHIYNETNSNMSLSHCMYNSFWSWIRIIKLIKVWVSPGSSSPIYSGTGCTILIIWELFIPIQ